MTARGFLIAGTASGVGKTTVATGITGALSARGLRVQPFKTGPDYIDPTYLSRAAGRACRNLDSWMLPAPAVRDLFARASADADVAVVEGVMGLFDGRADEETDDGGAAGSAAHLARLLGLPVVLVVDARAMAQSAAALVLGFQRYQPDLRIAGVILNRVAGTRHAELCAGPITAATGLPVFGALPRAPELAVPERHLGLVPDSGAAEADALFQGITALVTEHLDLDALLACAAPVTPAADSGLFPAQPIVRPRARIAIARDAAFHFYYEDSLDLLRAWGAELVPFSPLTDHELPTDCGAVYIGGGFPELFAAKLASNARMLAALRAAAAGGVPIYGECGGLMYLGSGVTDFEGARHAMAGLVPAESIMRGSRLTLGYREVESCGTPLLPAGERMRGHEFHWSALETAASADTAAYRVLDQAGRPDGFRVGSVTASYVHAHLAARADLAPNFVATAEGDART
ncbi:MAG: cobyrinate a,c-diamide synthase [Chloroflexi bacterium]|nr:MAG: cobyrinate a,c-diamide synthase [Chloroflexota bacterium]